MIKHKQSHTLCSNANDANKRCGRKEYTERKKTHKIS